MTYSQARLTRTQTPRANVQMTRPSSGTTRSVPHQTTLPRTFLPAADTEGRPATDLRDESIAATQAIPLTRLTVPVAARRRRWPVVRCYARRPLGRSRWRAAVVLAALAPLTMLLTWKVASLAGDTLLNLYGVGVLLALFTTFFLAFVLYTDPATDQAASRVSDCDLPSVSFLVAVKDEVDDIEKCVRSMASSHYPKLEVIVVDDASTDGTSDVLDKLSHDIRVQVIHLPKNVGKKRALVEAFRRSTGEIIVFTDSDCLIAPEAVRQVVRAIVAHPDIGGVSGHARALNADVNLFTRVQDVWYDGQFGIAKAAESVFGSVSCVSGPLAAFRRDAISPYLPAWAGDRFAGAEFRFATDRQLTGYVLGQYWMGSRLRHRNRTDPLAAGVHVDRAWRVEYVRSARVWTNVPHTARSFFRQQARWKKSFIRNAFFTGTFYWRRGVVPSMLFYGHMLWVMLAPVMAFRHLVWLPLHAAWMVSLLYLLGIFFKGGAWAIGYRVQNPGCPRWRYRPLMSMASSLMLSWLLLYSALTLRRSVWFRG
jgi:cellulose synthase/poly-beta-1,6-N-acetylglucosamine synthase-like glycosyltransferase